jgi:hypothetical protein
MPALEDSSVLIVGLARNCEKKLFHSISKLSIAFKSAKSVAFLIIESDSSDATTDVLSQLASSYSSFKYVTLGSLLERYSLRTERIAFCRNYYLKLIKISPEYHDVDYVAIADLDGVNDHLLPSSVATCWTRSNWDVCTANQYGPYYDIYALRHSLWSPIDCSEQAKMLQSLGVKRFTYNYVSILSKMIRIPSDHDWIKVDSAFGGLAIYRKLMLENVRYDGLNENGLEVCEHVSLHTQIRSNGGRIYINPGLINAYVVDHARSATLLGLFAYWCRCQVAELFFSIARIFPLKIFKK